MVLVIFFMVLMITSFVISVILLIALPIEPCWIIFFGISVFCGIIFLISPFFIDNDDYDCGYDEGKKETINKEKKPLIVKLKTICPHCGAPMKNDTCAYCGCKSEIYKVIQ